MGDKMNWKFRGMGTDTREWVEGDLRHRLGKTYIGYEEDTFGHPVEHEVLVEVIPETVGLFSNILDTNEKLIAQGDKISFTVFDMNGNDTQYTGIVAYTGSKFIVINNEKDVCFGSDGPFDLDWIADQDETLEIIGSVHEGDR